MSPQIHRFWLRKLGLKGDYRTVRMTAEQLPSYLESRIANPDWRGCNLTMPLKQVAFDLAHEADPSTRRIGAINTLFRDRHRLVGTNTDWRAISTVLADRPEIGRAAIVGTGGAARAALEALRRRKVGHLILISRSQAKARRLLQQFELAGEVMPIGGAPAGDLLINASPLGMTGHEELPIDLSNLPPESIVFDCVYSPLATGLLEAARDRGLQTIDGLTMLIGQAALAFACFFGMTPDPADAAELRGQLTA